MSDINIFRAAYGYFICLILMLILQSGCTTPDQSGPLNRPEYDGHVDDPTHDYILTPFPDDIYEQ